MQWFKRFFEMGTNSDHAVSYIQYLYEKLHNYKLNTNIIFKDYDPLTRRSRGKGSFQNSSLLFSDSYLYLLFIIIYYLQLY